MTSFLAFRLVIFVGVCALTFWLLSSPPFVAFSIAFLVFVAVFLFCVVYLYRDSGT